MQASKTTRLCLLGSESAGKTCFIAGLGVLAEPHRKADFHVVGRDTGTQQYLNELVNALHARQWPGATTQTRLMTLDVRYRNALLQLSLLDYRGEEFRRAFHELDDTRIEALWSHLDGVDVVLLMLDPDIDVARGLPLDMEEERRRRERLNALLQSLISVCHAQLREGRRKALPDVAVLLSKRDKHPELNDGVTPRRYLESRAPELLRRLEDWSPRVGVYALSAVGGAAADSKLPTHAPPPPTDLRPTGYHELFEWVLWRKGARARRRAVRIVSAAVGVIVLLTGAWLAQVGWYQSRLRENVSASTVAHVDGAVWLPTTSFKNRLDAVVDAEMRRLRALMAIAPGLQGLQEIVAAAADLAKCKNSSRQDEARTLLADAQRERRRALFAAVRSAYEQGEPGFGEAASGYLREFPQGGEADEVRGMQHRRRMQDRDRERQQVRAIRPGEFRFLAKKADEIAAYLARYGSGDDDPVATNEMRRAERLARRLADTNTYTVRLRACGVFIKPRDHAVRVLRNGVEVRLYDPPSSASSSNWGADEAAFQIDWKSGDELSVELWSYDRSNNIAASESAKDPLSLRILSGRRSLTFADDWRPGDFSQGPFVRFEMDGFADDDWRVLHDWLYPGDKW